MEFMSQMFRPPVERIDVISSAFGKIEDVSPYDMIQALAVLSNTITNSSTKITAYLRKFISLYREKISTARPEFAEMYAAVEADEEASELWGSFQLAINYQQIADALRKLTGLPNSEPQEWREFRKAILAAASSPNAPSPPPAETGVRVKAPLRTKMLRHVEAVLKEIIIELNDFDGWSKEAARLERFVIAQKAMRIAISVMTFMAETNHDIRPLLAGVYGVQDTAGSLAQLKSAVVPAIVDATE
ncbi:hypothetical protein CAOG_03167 [Capsaspora owczarzaki ATCC 30864]|uniref:hypothetical protein n=1 Tax=Capsaspora owczarzaki (strain ATCC 30864) TaxID=595528 RepID=UPI00035207D0|nr:hypothetical protein CAOG_03167 [Capsaspora owczarzaki ATCC 30864]|eukprot:XP_004364006.2 hypothetical protein CAOG_03167 [Capsaspora owczarzaki ATCC 30864]